MKRSMIVLFLLLWSSFAHADLNKYKAVGASGVGIGTGLWNNANRSLMLISGSDQGAIYECTMMIETGAGSQTPVIQRFSVSQAGTTLTIEQPGGSHIQLASATFRLMIAQ